MIAKLSPELVQQLEQAGDQPLPVEHPANRRVYLLVDAERFDVVRRAPASPTEAEFWTETKNERRCALIRKKFSQGIDSEEARELAELQEELSAYRKQAVPLPYDVVEVLEAALHASPAPSAPPAS
jgi:hypothetical protein